MSVPPLPMTFEFLKEKCSEWKSTANSYLYLVVTLGVITILTSVFVSVYTGSDPKIIDPWLLKGIACLSTALLTLLTAFNMVNKSNDVRSAWRVLQLALLKYSEGIYTMDQLIADYKKGEDLMGSTTFNYGTPTKEDSEDIATQKDINQKDIRDAKTAATSYNQKDTNNSDIDQIDISKTSEVSYWSKKWGITIDQLKTARTKADSKSVSKIYDAVVELNYIKSID